MVENLCKQRKKNSTRAPVAYSFTMCNLSSLTPSLFKVASFETVDEILVCLVNDLEQCHAVIKVPVTMHVH